MENNNDDDDKIVKNSLVTDKHCERRSSITNTAIGSSLAASLVGISTSVSNDLLSLDITKNTKSATASTNSVCSTSPNDEQDDNCLANRLLAYRRKSRLPLLRIDMPQPHSWSNFDAVHEQEEPDNHSSPDNDNHTHHHHHHLHFPHIPVPSFSFTSTGPDGNPQRKFSFGIRRHSQMTLQGTDSMVSLCYRPLATYIIEDNLSGLQSFLENKRVTIDDRDENRGTVLMLAASKGKIQFVRELINHNADVNAIDNDNWSALLCAAKEGHTDVCLELLDHGADLEHRDDGGWTALMWASYKGRTNTVTFLLSRGADANAHGNYHISSLLWSAGRGHADIVKELLSYGAKVNVGDKYGTTALIWASRRGNIEIVDTLLKAGANIDTAGMYSWTALIVATMGNHLDVVMLLLEHKSNVNALDKDGNTALAIASKEGYHEIVGAILNAGAYINIQDRSGDTNLIHAVKGGHRSVAEALLKKYVDVDIAGKEKKTATYVAVEKGNVQMLKMLLHANPDLEIATKDGDTPLLRAVRSRNSEIVQLLLDKKAKVTAADKKGDTVLHIAMRARSKAIVEILLRNPKNSQLLYRPNKQGETPYNIDLSHPKTILGQIFGARRLNTNEDNENMLGYELYSSALADILSEPSLSTPITVGLYAKWGSGKGFLLNKLRNEMQNFAKQWIDPVFQFTSLLFVIILHIALIMGVILGLSLQSWEYGLSFGCFIIIFIYTILILIYYANNYYDWDWPYNFNVSLVTRLNSIKLLLQIIFCHPPNGIDTTATTATTTAAANDTDTQLTIQPIKFYFTDQMKVGTTVAGENAVVQMVGSLYDSIENDFGSLATRLYRAFRPKLSKSTTTWTWRHLCCLPYFVIFEICFLSFIIGIIVITIFSIDDFRESHLLNNQTNNPSQNYQRVIEKNEATLIFIIVSSILAFGIIANFYTWGRTISSLLFSQRRHLQRAIKNWDSLKSEGFTETLRSEVTLMTEMVRCLDRYTLQQSRLVLIVDGLDSCEQDKVLLVLDAMQALFSDNGCPFLIILAIDPHIIAKAVETNSRRLFTESNIGGHDYLRNMVHLPFYLQNSGLRKIKVAQQIAQHSKKTIIGWNDNDENVNYATTSAIHNSMSNRRLSTESSVMNSNEKLKPPSRKGSRKMRLSESVASSIGSNLNRLGGAQDLNKMLLTDDYFSDVNPRSMRRLMNVVYVTGRLLKAFQIDFNWYHLASWINITEQWPFRTSWLILYYDMCEDTLEDSTSLKTLYDKVRPQIRVLKDGVTFLDMDRDEKKMDVFLTFHRSSLLVSDMKIFLPFTINLDPYIKKKIKEEHQSIEENLNQGLLIKNPWHGGNNDPWSYSNKSTLTNRQSKSMRNNLQTYGSIPPSSIPPPPPPSVSSQLEHIQHSQLPGLPWSIPTYDWMSQTPWTHHPEQPKLISTNLPTEIMEMKLSTLNVNNICDLLSKIEDINSSRLELYKNIIRDNNINGKVLLYCELTDLKEVLKMAFGDWELFRMVIITMREQEKTININNEENARSVRFTVGPDQISWKDQRGHHQDQVQLNVQRSSSHNDKEKSSTSRTDGPPPRRDATKHSIMEKQVTLEEQMICGALQTLNEEALEDCLDVPAPEIPTDSLADCRPRSHSITRAPDTDYVMLQPSPIYHWVPVTDEFESSDSSSQDSVYRHSSITSQQSTRSTLSTSRQNLKKKTNNNNFNNRPRSLLISSPPSSPKPPNRSKSTDDTLQTTVNCPNTNVESSINNEIIINIPVTTVTTTQLNYDKFGRMKDCLMNDKSISNQVGISTDSDDESTPLVSELSTPSHAHSHTFSPDFQDRQLSLSLHSLNQRSYERSVNDDYCDAVSLIIHESSDTRLLERQNAEDWDSPETSV
ncbi:kinase D-interacting substrate of 220 kDa B isoform X2 [Aphidius gifuensis]|nr:kinase D-interacting substrate of 220 kDa B isoform X2 [Aphidius gifuensis]